MGSQYRNFLSPGPLCTPYRGNRTPLTTDPEQTRPACYTCPIFRCLISLISASKRASPRRRGLCTLANRKGRDDNHLNGFLGPSLKLYPLLSCRHAMQSDRTVYIALGIRTVAKSQCQQISYRTLSPSARGREDDLPSLSRSLAMMAPARASNAAWREIDGETCGWMDRWLNGWRRQPSHNASQSAAGCRGGGINN